MEMFAHTMTRAIIALVVIPMVGTPAYHMVQSAGLNPEQQALAGVILTVVLVWGAVKIIE